MSKSRTYFIATYGCQMNKADSEKIAGYYQSRGFSPAEKIEEADEIVVNTCSVRQSAEDRVYGLVNNLSKLKTQSAKRKTTTKNSKIARPKIILTGCMLRYPIKWLREKMPRVGEFRKLEEFVQNSQLGNLTTCLPARQVRNSQTHAWLPIMEGCNNFCTYCVVPYARGRERSRPFEEIVCEVEELARRDYKEITLLGQNVNSYGKDFSPKEKNKLLHHYNNIYHYSRVRGSLFALLLKVSHNIVGIKQISFMTSNPWDLTDDIIEAIKLPKIDRYLHLPVQSGDDEILRRMNRKYNAKEYLNLVQKIRQKIPEIEIGTDIIVGFPGETEEQFQNTVNLCKEVGFKVAYIAMYSPRLQTTAYKLKNDILFQEKKRRWKILEELINKPQRNLSATAVQSIALEKASM